MNNQNEDNDTIDVEIWNVTTLNENEIEVKFKLYCSEYYWDRDKRD